MIDTELFSWVVNFSLNDMALLFCAPNNIGTYDHNTTVAESIQSTGCTTGSSFLRRLIIISLILSPLPILNVLEIKVRQRHDGWQQHGQYLPRITLDMVRLQLHMVVLVNTKILVTTDLKPCESDEHLYFLFAVSIINKHFPSSYTTKELHESSIHSNQACSSSTLPRKKD